MNTKGERGLKSRLLNQMICVLVVIIGFAGYGNGDGIDAVNGMEVAVEGLEVEVDGLTDTSVAEAVRLVPQAGRPPMAVIEYLNLDEAEVSRQQAFAQAGIQEIGAVVLPEGKLAGKAPNDIFGWPHAGLVGDALIVHFRIYPLCGRQASGLIRSTDGGRNWGAPRFLEDGWIYTFGAVESGRLVGVAIHKRRRNTLTVITSDDDGETWEKHFAEVNTPNWTTARMVEHPRFGLIVGGHPTRNRLVFLVSEDEGKTWRQVSFSLPGFYTDGTVVFAKGERIGVFVRTDHGGRQWSAFAQCWPTNIDTAERFEDIEWKWGSNNIFVAKMDTPDAVYNPVSGRIEAVTTKRDAGFPYRDTGLNEANDDGYMTLNLWSMDPDAFFEGELDWRFEGVLLRSKGEKARLKDPREGMHPSGTVIDEQNGVQHIFIYGGNRAHGRGAPELGKTGVFRISRTLDTDRWRERSAELDRYDEIFRVEEQFESLSGWVTSGSPDGALAFHRTEPPRRVGDSPLPEGGEISADESGNLLVRTGDPGYYGLHKGDVMVTRNYRFAFKARIDAYSDGGDTLGVNVNYGQENFHLILRRDGVYDIEAPGTPRRIRKMDMGGDWHVWTVTMRDGNARIYRDGEFIGTGSPMIEPAVGNRPISIYSKLTKPNGGAEWRMEYFMFESLVGR